MAKLTKAQRDRLPKSTFCGPNRSFPVPDMTHVRVAKAYLPRSQIPDRVKKQVLQCIVRKEKQLQNNKKGK